MSYTKRIQSLWEENNGQNLSIVLTKILDLIDEAYQKDERVPADLELDILLNANYALGFGTSPAEANRLANLLEFILSNYNRDLVELADNGTKLHRLACTLSSVVITMLSSGTELEELKQIRRFNGLVNPSIADLLENVTHLMIKAVSYGKYNKWQLELFSFIITLIQLQIDLGSVYQINSTQESLLVDTVNNFDTTSEIWFAWKDDWLEKSDYYRFVTLMLTSTSSSEEIWLDKLDEYLKIYSVSSTN